MKNRFVDPVIQKVMDHVFKYAEDQVRWQTGMKEELERLRENHPKIQAVVDFASSQEQMRDQNPFLHKWLSQLRDAIDEADDVLDEIEYMKRGEQLSRNRGKTKGPSTTTSFLHESASKIRKVGQRAFKSDPNLKRIEEVVQKLDKVSAGVATFLHLVQDVKQEQHLELNRARETGSLPQNDLIGRGKEKEFVMNWLRNPSNEYQASRYSNISLLCILGHGGMGKTTLLQHAYEDVKTEEFDLKMWVCVSNNFNVKQVIANMLESLKNERPCLETLEALQKRLQSLVESKKFLLVLDDIWDDEKEQDKNKWKNVLAPLAFGKLGSKILVTTRMESVALIISGVMNLKKEILRLDGLKDDECLLLLLRYAFQGWNDVENIDPSHNLRSIAKKMIKKLSGSPLATTVMGGILNSHLEETHWTRVLNYDTRSTNDILPILKLSYIFLPKNLQKCLSFCCTFPQDYKLYKDDIVPMWIALDFIQPSNNQGETLKDIGERYFDFIVQKSLLDKFQIYDETYYKLHDILHDMLRVVSAQECFSIVNDEECVSITPEIIRHLYVQANRLGVLEDTEKFGKLRSLFLTTYIDENAGDCFGILSKIFKALKRIRLLVIYAPYFKKIPEDIGHLIHLRYLKIICREYSHLPRSLSHLYHLQFILIDKSVFQRVPFRGIPEVGKLNFLQMLDYFDVRNEVGYRFEELEHMNELSLLAINFAEDMNDAIHACSAKLCDKKNLRDLSLVWYNNKYRGLLELEFNDFKMNAEQNVLDNLKPHNSLKKLNIDSFMGARFAIWMKVNLFSNLEYIKITSCWKLQTLPPFWQLGVLKYLHLENMPNVKGFDYEPDRNDEVRVFPSLQVLSIINLQALEDWFVQTTTTYDCLFPCLSKLQLLGCPNLRELPALPPHLKKIKINYIGWKGCKWLQGISNCFDISIENCPDLIFLVGRQEVETNEKCQLIISKLIIKDPSLLLMEPLRSISSIRKLEILDNDVISFPP